MTTQAKKKQRRRSPGFIAGLVLLFVAIVILLTLAMFTSFDEVTNVFEAGKVDIVLTETEWKPQDGDNTVPNTFIDKNPNIINKEETVNTYVFLKVTIPYERLNLGNAPLDNKPIPLEMNDNPPDSNVIPLDEESESSDVKNDKLDGRIHV